MAHSEPRAYHAFPQRSALATAEMRGVVSRSTSPAVSGVSDGLRRISVALASFEAVDDNRMTGRNPKGPFDVPAFVPTHFGTHGRFWREVGK